MTPTALFTDYYELTMIQGYFLKGHNPEVIYDMFFRRPPFNSGFSVFAGLEDLLTVLQDLRFSEDDISYLKDTGSFKDEFLTYIKDFKFSGDVYSVQEGSVVFPNEPLIKIHAPLIEAQIIESLLLNIINFQTLIATKTSRIYLASDKGAVLEFGMRRAQGYDGAMSASRASFIGGASATSNTLAGKKFNIPVSGTMAHSWIMSFPSEEEAFLTYARLYPENSIFLIDTYDSLGSGIENAIKAGTYLKEQNRGFGIRLDSGDLQYLSQKVREHLDNAGFPEAKIAVSNELNEEIIHQLVTSNAPIDVWGIGTQMVTGGNDSALSGVYKLAAIKNNRNFQPVMKLSEHPEKMTTPGDKRVIRYFDEKDSPIADLMCLFDENCIDDHKDIKLFHPTYNNMKCRLKDYAYSKELLCKVMERGQICTELPSLQDIQKNTIENITRLDNTFTRLINPHIYKVSITEKLRSVKNDIIKKYSSDEE